MTKEIKRLNFDIDTELLKELDIHILKNKHKYSTRSEFLRHAILTLLDLENEDNYINKQIVDEVKHLKSLLELNIQFTYSMMECQELKVSNLYYGNSLRAIKGKEAIDEHYRDKLMNENKIQKEELEEEKKEDKRFQRITIDDL